MTTTHVFVGAALGVATAGYVPELTPAAIIAGGVGGAWPDADLIATHRRSLHFPVGYGVVATVAVAAALLAPAPESILAAVFLLAATLHCVMDIFGGGVEVRPWEATSQRGVYNHTTGRWIRPRRWVRYAGAPEDFLLASVAVIPLMLSTGGHARTAVVVLWVSSGVFTLVRQRLTGLSERIAE